MYGQIVAWGLYAWPALLTVTLLVPVFGSNPLIAAIVGFGFEGGHGLSAGMRDTFEALGYPEVRPCACPFYMPVWICTQAPRHAHRAVASSA
jgi:Na+/glutamate symporter